MHKNSNFTLYSEVIKYERYVRQYVVGQIASVHRDLRIHLLDEIYKLERYLMEAQFTRGNIRIKNITEMIVTISMIDILCSEIVEFCPKSKKYMTKSFEMLTKIKNMTFAWRNNPEPVAHPCNAALG